MQNHQLDLQAGETVRIGAYTISLLEIEDDAVLLRIEGPDGEVVVEPLRAAAADSEVEDSLLEPALV